jgi:hypothetical protein
VHSFSRNTAFLHKKARFTEGRNHQETIYIHMIPLEITTIQATAYSGLWASVVLIVPSERNEAKVKSFTGCQSSCLRSQVADSALRVSTGP